VYSKGIFFTDNLCAIKLDELIPIDTHERGLRGILTDIPRISGSVRAIISLLALLGKEFRPRRYSAGGRSGEFPASRGWNWLLCVHRGAPLPS
jgi:hypothetical protein